MEELLNKINQVKNNTQDDQNLEQKRRSQKTREKVTVHRIDKEEPEIIENVQLIHAVPGWTLFEKVDGTQCWRKDENLAGYDDPEGAN